MKVITICGSLKYIDKMQEKAEELATKGYCVLTPTFPYSKNEKTKEEIHNLKLGHLKRIEISDAIYVINVDNYIGESTFKEIEYATKLNKEIIYLEN